jgi:MFS family permease
LIEFLLVSHSWLTTFLAVWWAVGYTITGLLAWALLGNYSCAADAESCTNADNMGWRYLHFTCGGLIIVLALLRFFVIRMPQTPKWMVTQNRDEDVFELLSNLATRYDRPMSLTL